MTFNATTSNNKFRLKIIRYDESSKLSPQVHLTAIEEVNVFDVAEAIYKDCYMGNLGVSIRDSKNAYFIIKTHKSKYRFWFFTPKDFENMLVQITQQFLI